MWGEGIKVSSAVVLAFAASLAQVLEAAPDFANGWFNLGKMRQQLGQTDEAIYTRR